MYNNQKAPKQPKVTSDNAMAIARSKSATDAQSKAWDSRYVADALVDIQDNDNVSLTFITPRRTVTHNGEQFAPDIASAIGDKSMAIFNRRGATMMSFQRQGKSFTGEVEEPCANVKTDGTKFSFRMTGEEMKAAFTYINAKRKHSYTPNYNSATFASHVMAAAGFSVNAKTADSFVTATNSEIAKEDKKEWTQYNYVISPMDQTKPKLPAHIAGYETEVTHGTKVRSIKETADKFNYNGVINDSSSYHLSTLYTKFATSASLNILLNKYSHTNRKEDADAVFNFLLLKRAFLDKNDVNDCESVFQNDSTCLFKLNLMRNLYNIPLARNNSGYPYPRIMTNSAIGNGVFLKSVEDVLDFLSYIDQIFGKNKITEIISKNIFNTWSSNLSVIFKTNPLKNKDYVRSLYFDTLYTVTDGAIRNFFDRAPVSLIQTTTRDEIVKTFQVLRTALENEFCKIRNANNQPEFYEKMKTVVGGKVFSGTENYINKLYEGEKKADNEDEDIATQLLKRSVRLINRATHNENVNNIETLSEYAKVNAQKIIDSIWLDFDKQIANKFAKNSNIPTTAIMFPIDITNIFSVVQKIESYVPGLIDTVKSNIKAGIKSMDPALLQAAGFGDLVPNTDTQGEAN